MVPKILKGGLVRCNIHFVAKYQKTFISLQNIKKLEEGTLWRHLKIFEKKSQFQKSRKGDPLVSSSFVGYVKKVKNERGTICTKFPLAGLGLSNFGSFCKKWIFQCEVCGLKEDHRKSRAIFASEKAPTKKQVF